MAWKSEYQKKKPHRPRMTDEEFKEYQAWKSEEKERLKGLKAEAKAQGIPLDKVKQYWYKSKHYSINVKGEGSKSLEEIKQEILDEIKDFAPKYPKVKRKKTEDGHLLVVDIADLHINKYAEAELTGDDYNTQIAVKRALLGTEGILQKASGFNIDKIVFVIGNDVLNTDTISRTTTKGTPQDTDTHWFKAFTIAREVYVRCIEMCLQVADVDVIHCPSNHDFMSSCFLADSLKSWFRLNKQVKFDSSPAYRKYYQYHNNMLEFEHGDKGKMAQLPLVMAQEKPQMWAETKFRYGYLHHVHHSDKNQFKSSKDYIGVNVTYLRSPSSADLYHYDNQYLNIVAVEGFVHSKEMGRVAHLTHYF